VSLPGSRSNPGRGGSLPPDIQALFGNVTLEDVEREYLKRNFKEFVKAAWQYVDPDPLVWNWHMDAICDHLQGVSDGHITNLLINVPPGTSKTQLTSVLWPAFEWAGRPEGRWMFASYDHRLSTQHSVRCRTLIGSPWYQARWPVQITTDQNQKTYFENERKGYRLATSVGSHGLGQHPDRIVIDDPQDDEGAASDIKRASTLEWWRGTISTRGVSRGVRKVCIMQRLHEEDLAAHLLDTKEWTHLMLPMRYEPERKCVTFFGGKKFEDPRTEPGELLDKKRFPEDKVASMEAELGPYKTAGQFQQRPQPAGGGIIKKAWFRFWIPFGEKAEDWPKVRDERGSEFFVSAAPERFDQEILSLDCSKLREAEDLRKKGASDPVSLGAWGRSGPNNYLLDRVNEKLDMFETAEALTKMAAEYPNARGKLIEYAANGPYVMAILRRSMDGLIPVTPEGSKVSRVITAARTDKARDARALSMEVLFRAGNVLVPHPLLAKAKGWDVWEYVAEICGFPNAPHDDDVDMTSQALAFLQPRAWQEEDAAAREIEKNGPPPKDTRELVRRRMDEAFEKSKVSNQSGRSRGASYRRARG
jgi:predicted phage terminase large subunit-like protein